MSVSQPGSECNSKSLRDRGRRSNPQPHSPLSRSRSNSNNGSSNSGGSSSNFFSNLLGIGSNTNIASIQTTSGNSSGSDGDACDSDDSDGFADAPDSAREKEKDGPHLIVMQHGFQGHSYDMRIMRNW